MVRLRVRFVEVQKKSRAWSSIRRAPSIRPSPTAAMRAVQGDEREGEALQRPDLVPDLPVGLHDLLGSEPDPPRPPTSAPMLLPPTRSISMPDSMRARSTPMWAKPRAPPPPSTSPVAVREVPGESSPVVLDAGQQVRLAGEATRIPPECGDPAGRMSRLADEDHLARHFGGGRGDPGQLAAGLPIGAGRRWARRRAPGPPAGRPDRSTASRAPRPRAAGSAGAPPPRCRRSRRWPAPRASRPRTGRTAPIASSTVAGSRARTGFARLDPRPDVADLHAGHRHQGDGRRRAGAPRWTAGSSQPAMTRVSWSALVGILLHQLLQLWARLRRPTSVSRTARTVAVRRGPVSRATSPTLDPRPISRTIVSVPSSPTRDYV